MWSVSNWRRRSSKATVKKNVPPGTMARMYLGMATVYREWRDALSLSRPTN
jgi:hypothetical protein